MKLLFSLLLSLCYVFIQAQTGKISGTVIDEKNGEVLYGATILIEGTSKGVSVNIETGLYILENVNPGKYNLIVQYISYQTKKITDVEVKGGQTTTVNIALDGSSGFNLDSLIVTDYRITNNEVAILEEIKEADGVVSGLSGETIKKGSDRDGAEVARRIPGVTVVDNRFVMVRGLSERYNAVLLNNALTPSVETDVKSFSFDLIPSQMIDKFLIYKSPSADLPGEFAGGAIKIYTKNIPEKNEISAGYSSSYRNNTTFQPFIKAEGASTDWLGFDNKFRKLPDDFPNNIREIQDPEELQKVGQSLNNSWKYNYINAPIDHRLNLFLAKKFEKDKFILGTVTSLSYSNTYTSQVNERTDYNTYDMINHMSDTVFNYHDTVCKNQARFGILHNWGLKYKGTVIELKNTFNQTGYNEATIRGGINFEEGTERREYSFRNNQRTIYTGQLNGTHSIKENITKLDWTLGYSMTRRKDPDWKRARYTRDFYTNDPFVAYVSTTANPFFLGRLFFNLKEDIYMNALNFEHAFTTPEKLYNEDGKLNKFLPKIKAGYYIENKSRQFSVRNIGYAPSSIFNFNWNLIYKPIDSLLINENLNTTNGFKIAEDTKGSDSYIANNRLLAGYVMGSIPITKKLYAVGGVRLENNLQSLYSNLPTNDTVIIENNITRLLPSINISYNFSDTCLIRFGYGRTLNRPEFRELAPLYFYDFVFNSILSGNDTLKTPTIDNFDLRYEVYPHPTEFLSIGLFYKKFTNPIESYFLPGVGSGGTRSFIPGNAPQAYSAGVEIDIRKSFANFTKIKFINDLSVVANASLIKSKIVLAADSVQTGVNNQRPMMGQSPYIINGGLYYQNDSINLSVSLLYNVIGQRIAIVGVPGIPEVWEMPRNVLDLTITKGIGKYTELRFSIQDILNQPYLLLQDANEDGIYSRTEDQKMQSYRRGTYFTFGIKVTL